MLKTCVSNAPKQWGLMEPFLQQLGGQQILPQAKRGKPHCLEHTLGNGVTTSWFVGDYRNSWDAKPKESWAKQDRQTAPIWNKTNWHLFRGPRLSPKL